DDALAAGLVEIDGELVAVHLGHRAVAEFFVEHALAQRIARHAGGGGDELAFERHWGARPGPSLATAALLPLLLGALPARRRVAALEAAGGFIEAAVAVGVEPARAAA